MSALLIPYLVSDIDVMSERGDTASLIFTKAGNPLSMAWQMRTFVGSTRLTLQPLQATFQLRPHPQNRSLPVTLKTPQAKCWIHLHPHSHNTRSLRAILMSLQTKRKIHPHLHDPHLPQVAPSPPFPPLKSTTPIRLSHPQLPMVSLEPGVQVPQLREMFNLGQPLVHRKRSIPSLGCSFCENT
jgi:hypothetical protein